MVGRFLTFVLEALLWAFFPLVLLLAIWRWVQSQRQVQRTLQRSRQLSSAKFIEALLNFEAPADAAEYVRLIRVRRSEEASRLPRSFIRQLERLIERTPQTAQQMADMSDLEASIRSAAADDRLTPRILWAWRGEVLDELGQLDEFLRER